MSEKDKKEKDKKEIKLSDGRIATIRKGKGKDLFWALEMASTTNEILKMLTLRLVEIEGKQITEDELEELPIQDVMKLIGEVSKIGAPLSEKS